MRHPIGRQLSNHLMSPLALMSKSKTSETRVGDVFVEVNGFSRLHRFVGLFTLVYTKGKFRVSRNWLVVNLIILIFILMVNLNSVFTTRKKISYDCPLYYYLSVAQLISICYGVVGNLVQCVQKVGLLNRCLLVIRAVDLVLFSVGTKRPTTKVHYSILFIMTMVVTTYILRLHLQTSLPEALSLLCMYAIHTLILLLYAFIDRMASVLLLSFKSLQQSILKCSGMDGNKAAVLAEKLIYCHHKLCNASQDFNDFSSLQILAILAVEFITSFGEVYVLICILFNGGLNREKLIVVTIKSIWTLIALSLLWQMSHRFAYIRNEAKEFNTLLYQIMIEDKTNEILNNPKLKLHIAMNREVVFTAYGFFNLDYSLVHSIIASSTTYLVILLQFSEEPASDPGGVTSGNIGNATTTPLPFFLTTV
ncbi:Gustatory receptor 139b [Halyomorpha halys]|nr:Gustatory receptor 139b [Halyomorpha halys]